MRGTARRTDLRERMERAAAHKVGEDNAYFIIVVWPTLKVAVPPVAAGLGALWLWTHVAHPVIAFYLAVAGALALATYAASLALAFGAKARMRHRTMGQRRHVAWHIVGAAGAVLLGLAVWIVA